MLPERPNLIDIPRAEATREFIDYIIEADGSLVTIPGRTSLIGEPLIMSARYGRNINDLHDLKNYLNIDVFADRGSKLEPIGMRDYSIQRSRSIARGFVSYRGYLDCPSPAHTDADSKWKNSGLGVAVMPMTVLEYVTEDGGMADLIEKIAHEGLLNSIDTPIYRGRGVGALMTAAAIHILHAKGVSKIQFALLSREGKDLWSKFGKDEYNDVVSVDAIMKHPYTNQVIESF